MTLFVFFLLGGGGYSLPQIKKKLLIKYHFLCKFFSNIDTIFEKLRPYLRKTSKTKSMLLNSQKDVAIFFCPLSFKSNRVETRLNIIKIKMYIDYKLIKLIWHITFKLDFFLKKKYFF